MDPLGQLYLLSMIFGWGFIVGCFLLGQAGHGHGGHSAHGHAGDAGHIGGGHVGGGHGGHVGHSGHAGDAGHGGQAGHSGGAGHSGHSAGSGHAGHSSAGGHNGHAGDGHAGHSGHSGQSGHANHSNQEGGQRGIRGLDEVHAAHGLDESSFHASDHGVGNGGGTHTSVNPSIKSRDNQFYFTLISIISPMKLSTFAGFFGSGGFLAWHYAPWLGYATLIPAVVSGYTATLVMKSVMSLMVSKLNSSSLIRQEESIGRIAQVSTPISDGRMGEVSYVIGTSRFNASAKPAHPGEDFQRGSKVMIVQTEGPVVYVGNSQGHRSGVYVTPQARTMSKRQIIEIIRKSN